eukprot:4001657-Alexandrium_andersonii.AAC.1
MAPAAASISAASTMKSWAWPSAPRPSRPAPPSQPASSKLPLMYSRASSATGCAQGFALFWRT